MKVCVLIINHISCLPHSAVVARLDAFFLVRSKHLQNCKCNFSSGFFSAKLIIYTSFPEFKALFAVKR